MYRKIARAYDFRITSYNKGTMPGGAIDMSDEIQFIQANNLVNLNELNEFKLGNIEVSGNQTMI